MSDIDLAARKVLDATRHGSLTWVDVIEDDTETHYRSDKRIELTCARELDKPRFRLAVNVLRMSFQGITVAGQSFDVDDKMGKMLHEAVLKQMSDSRRKRQERAARSALEALGEGQ